MWANEYFRLVACIETKRKFTLLCSERLNRTSFFQLKIVTNCILNFQFLSGLETNFWLQDRDLIGTRPRPCLNIRDQDRKNLVSRPRPISKPPALQIASLKDGYLLSL